MPPPVQNRKIIVRGYMLFFVVYMVLTLTVKIQLHAQGEVSVTLRVETDPFEEGRKVFVSGNVSQLGLWAPDKVSLEIISAGIWEKKFSFRKGTTIEYKFTNGNWNTEALRPDSTIPPNFILKVEHDTIVTTKISLWRTGTNLKITGQITGKVEYHKKISIKGLKPRDLIVWLPPGYEKETKKHYPVFYMHDGQNLFDPRTSSGLKDWRVDETADSLIRIGEIKPVIVVGIYNTSDRSAEYGDTRLGHLYMKLIVKKIKPMIDSKYRTLRDRNNTAVGGSSMGGLISMICAWEYPEVFSKAACFSPAFKISTIDYVKNIKSYTGKKKGLKFYIDNGGVDLDAKLRPGVDAMVEALKNKGYVENSDLFIYIDKGATHNESAWARRVWRPLTLFFDSKNSGVK
jgi:enterochelin esterase-like enzyme